MSLLNIYLYIYLCVHDYLRSMLLIVYLEPYIYSRYYVDVKLEIMTLSKS